MMLMQMFQPYIAFYRQKFENLRKQRLLMQRAKKEEKRRAAIHQQQVYVQELGIRLFDATPQELAQEKAQEVSKEKAQENQPIGPVELCLEDTPENRAKMLEYRILFLSAMHLDMKYYAIKDPQYYAAFSELVNSLDLESGSLQTTQVQYESNMEMLAAWQMKEPNNQDLNYLVYLYDMKKGKHTDDVKHAFSARLGEITEKLCKL